MARHNIPPPKKTIHRGEGGIDELKKTSLMAKYYYNIDERGEWYSGEATYITQIDHAEWCEDERS